MEQEQIKQLILSRAAAAKLASRKLAGLSVEARNKILKAMAGALIKEKDDIIFRNSIDVEAAKEAGLSEALVDRLVLNEKRIEDMAKGLLDVAALDDPIGEVIADWTPPAGVNIKKVKVPLGLIAMIYESRPNVTVDAAGLCLKAGNAVLLRGGSEAINSNRTLVNVISQAAYSAGLPQGAIQFVETTDRYAVSVIAQLDNLVDLLIPRGGEEMIKAIRGQATVPVLSHGKGLCHTYIDKAADVKKAIDIAVNAKCQRPGVCNAMETLLVHKDIAKDVLPSLCAAYTEKGVEVRGCSLTTELVQNAVPAKDEDWSTEYLSLILSIKVVESIDEAINHINKYNSGHSEAIITEDKQTAERFIREVDASAVFHNASTRLHDGSVFGLGSEIGISTQKLHARGTMGIRELTTTKYVVSGNGEIRE